MPNKFSAEYKDHILEAAYRVGEDENGTLGLVGYFRWIARGHPRIMCRLLGSVMELQELEIGLPEKPRPTVEEFDEAMRRHIGLGSNDRMQSEAAEADGHKAQAHLSWAWTGRDDPVGQLMH